jgi:hypothetical protein
VANPTATGNIDYIAIMNAWYENKKQELWSIIKQIVLPHVFEIGGKFFIDEFAIVDNPGSSGTSNGISRRHSAQRG